MCERVLWTIFLLAHIYPRQNVSNFSGRGIRITWQRFSCCLKHHKISTQELKPISAIMCIITSILPLDWTKWTSLFTSTFARFIKYWYFLEGKLKGIRLWDSNWFLCGSHFKTFIQSFLQHLVSSKNHAKYLLCIPRPNIPPS